MNMTTDRESFLSLYDTQGITDIYALVLRQRTPAYTARPWYTPQLPTKGWPS